MTSTMSTQHSVCWPTVSEDLPATSARRPARRTARWSVMFLSAGSGPPGHKLQTSSSSPPSDRWPGVSRPESHRSEAPAPFGFLFRNPRPPGGRAAPSGTCSLSAAAARVPGRALPSSKLHLPAVPAKAHSRQWVPAQSCREVMGGTRGATWEVRSRAPQSCWGRTDYTPQDSSRGPSRRC